MIFTFDDDDKKKVPNHKEAPVHSYFFKIPQQPVVTLPNGDMGGSFEESFEPKDFIEACFETTLIKQNPQIEKQDFKNNFNESMPFYNQIVKFLQEKGLKSYLPSKIEIAENLATTCDPEPTTYVQLAELIKNIREQHPVW